MGTTADKLNKLLQTKQEIKQAIIDKGVDISDEDTFASYPEKISSIQVGGDGVNWLDIISDNGTRGEYLFYNCDEITELDLSDLDTSKMTSMLSMFDGCKRLPSLDLSGFDTSNVTNMGYMFGNCYHIASLDLSGFDTSNVTSMVSMFSYIGHLSNTVVSLDLSNFDISKVTNMNHMFSGCANITSLDLSSFVTPKATSITFMFNGCSKLTSLDLRNFDISKVTKISNMFAGCSALIDFYPPKNINAPLDISGSTALSHDSLLRILNNLMETTTTKTLTLGATNLAKLTDEEKAIATNKGWTLA